MAKRMIGQSGESSKSGGVSTSADVKAFRAANAEFTARVTTTKRSAQSYVRSLERKVGLTSQKKK